MSDPTPAAPIVAQKAPYGVDVEAGKLWFCGCKATTKSPLCDGSHKNL